MIQSDYGVPFSQLSRDRQFFQLELKALHFVSLSAQTLYLVLERAPGLSID